MLPTSYEKLFSSWKKKKHSIEGIKVSHIEGRDYTREKVRIRDKHTCQFCGKKWLKGKRKLDVHHIDEDKEKTLQYDSPKESENMITLCHKCHLNVPGHRKKMSKISKEWRKKRGTSIHSPS